MTRRRRKIKKANITYVSLCKRGKNRQPVLYKSEDGGMVEFSTLHKAGDDFDEKGQILTLVWAKGYTDTDGDFADDGEVVTDMAHSFMRNGAKVDVRHNGIPLRKEQAFAAESFIIQEGDPRYADWKDTDGNPVDATGGWGAVFQIDDPQLRKQYREGEWDGVSLFGPATVEEVETKAASLDSMIEEAARAFVAERLGQQIQDGESEMKPDELKKALEEGFSTLGQELSKSIAAAINPPKPDEAEIAKLRKTAEAAGLKLVKAEEAPKAPAVEPFDPSKPPVFTGNPMSRKDVLAHARRVELHKSHGSLDFNDPDALARHIATLEKDDDPSDDLTGMTMEEKIEAYERQLNKQSRGPRSGFVTRGGPAGNRLVKAHEDETVIGDEMASFMNDQWAAGSPNQGSQN